jgi:2,3-bisphosphoglycerate-independent phosphoglycerate mutase
MKYKLLYVVLDGAPDGLNAPRRSLEEAEKPNIDSLAKNSVCGGVYTIAKGVAPESDMAVMSLLGYNPQKFYTGRGVIEAIGSDMEFKDGWVAFRANFATIDVKTRRLIDRRVGRSLSSREAKELGKALDGLELGGGEAIANFKATIGHRGVLIIKHKERRLSANVTNSDPAYERRGYLSIARPTFEPYILKVKPLDDREESRLTAELANEFIDRAIEILDKHPINIERLRKGLLPANAVLIRDASDKLPPVKPLREVYNIDMASIVEMPVERGIAKVIGLSDIRVEVEGKDRKRLLEEEAYLAIKALENHDGVYVHLKGPDEPGHDGDFEGKVKAVEDIDKYFFNKVLNNLDLEKVLIIVTSDHATPWHVKAHTDDPVALMISHPNIRESHSCFCEKICYKGSLGVFEGGYKILPKAIELSKTI